MGNEKEETKVKSSWLSFGKKTTPSSKDEKGFWSKTGSTIGKWGRKAGEAAANTVVRTAKKTTDPFVDIANKANSGELSTREVIGSFAKETVRLGVNVSTGGVTGTIAGQAIDKATDIGVRTNLISEGTGDTIKHGVRITANPYEYGRTKLMNESIRFARENDPTNTSKIIDNARGTYSSLKKPGKYSDRYAAAKVLADKVSTQNKANMVTASEAELKWKAYIRKKIDAAAAYMNGKSQYTFTNNYNKQVTFNGAGATLREELTDALYKIVSRNTNSVKLFQGTIAKASKMKLILDFYSEEAIRELDGKATFIEDFYLSRFMKQFLSYNGTFNMPSASRYKGIQKTTNQESISVISELGGGDYGGDYGIRGELLDSENHISVSIEGQSDSIEHRTGETNLKIELLDESGSVVDTLKFKEYLGDADDSYQCTPTCKSCGEAFSRIKEETLKCEFTFDGDLEIWFEVDAIKNPGDAENIRGYYWKSSELSGIDKNSIKTFKIKPDNS
ncbi:MAG: hypothetical protein EBY39_13180 [Flavobacteriia bacterium]|nr:hypothetical protein [Flavobacteriia bacterium]